MWPASAGRLRGRAPRNARPHRTLGPAPTALALTAGTGKVGRPSVSGWLLHADASTGFCKRTMDVAA